MEKEKWQKSKVSLEMLISGCNHIWHKIDIIFFKLSHIDAHHLKAIDKGFQNLVLVCWSDAYKPSYTNLKFSHIFGWFLGNLKKHPKYLSKRKIFEILSP